MLSKLWLTVLLCVGLLTSVAHAETDFAALASEKKAAIPMIVYTPIHLAPGETVSKYWHEAYHLYFEDEQIGWNMNDFCNAIRTFRKNQHLANLFTDVADCTNTGFNHMPANVTFWVPSYVGSYDVPVASENVLVYGESKNYAGPWEVSKEIAFPYLVERANSMAPAGKRAQVIDANAKVISVGEYADYQALKAQANAPKPAPLQTKILPAVQTTAATPFWRDFFFWTSALLLVLGLVAAARNRHLAMRRQILQNELNIAQSELKHIKSALRLTTVEFTVPLDMRPESDQSPTRYLPVLQWEDEKSPQASNARVHLAGADMQGVGVEYDPERPGHWNFSKVLKHLNDTGKGALRSRTMLHIAAPKVRDLPAASERSTA